MDPEEEKKAFMAWVHATQQRMAEAQRILEERLGVVDKRLVACELIGGPFDGLTVELPGIPPEPHLDIPPDGVPKDADSIFRWMESHDLAELVRYELEHWDGLRTAKYRYTHVSASGAQV